MSELETKFNGLTEKIALARKKTENSTRISAIVYIVLVLFVFGYTSVILNLLKQKATPDSISAQIRLMIDRDLLTDENRKYVTDSCREQTPVIADALVKLVQDQIMPNVETSVKKLIDAQVDSMIARLEKDVYPEISKVIKEHSEELQQHKDITDEQVANELAKILAKDLDREMGEFINDKLKWRMEKLAKELDEISSKPYSSLTCKEAAERRLIVN